MRGWVCHRSTSSGGGSSDGGVVWPGIDPGTMASSSSPQRPTQPGPTTPEASGGQPSLQLPLLSLLDLAAIALWGSSLSDCTNKALIGKMREYAKGSNGPAVL